MKTKSEKVAKKQLTEETKIAPQSKSITRDVMVVLIGIENHVYQEIIGEAFLPHYEKVYLATFNNEKMAREYAESCRLKNVVRRSYDSDKVFKDKTLLSNCVGYEIEVWHSLPHNPSI